MEKIILVSREPGDHEHMIALIEVVFPECTVEIIPGTDGESDVMTVPHSKTISVATVGGSPPQEAKSHPRVKNQKMFNYFLPRP